MSSLNLRKFVVYLLFFSMVVTGFITLTTRQSHASNKSLRHSLTPTVNESAAETGPQAKTADEAKRARAREAYNKRPLSFEENHGQADRHVKYISRGAGYMLFLSPTEVVLTLRRSDGEQATSTVANAQSSTVQPHPHRSGIVRMKLSGANPAPAITGESKMAALTNRPGGTAAQKPNADVAHYERVRYSQVYDGVDLIYYGLKQQLKYDFEVAPFADASRIVLEFGVVHRVKVERRTGELVLETAGGEVRQRQPVAYQEAGGVRREVESRYVELNRNRVGIEVGEYDRTIPLVINSVLSYATYLGGDRQDSGATSSSASQAPDQSKKDQPVTTPDYDGDPSISGYVLDDYGFGVEGVLMTLGGDEDSYTYTDVDGFYSFYYLYEHGCYTVTPSSPYYGGFSPVSWSICGVVSHYYADFYPLSGPYSISGYVTDSDGYGLEGVFIYLEGAAVSNYAYTDSDGYYYFGGLYEGDDYYLYAYSPDYTMDPYEQDIYNLQGDQENVNFLAIYSPYTISGRVRWDGHDVSGVGVSLLLDGTEVSYTSTDGYGYYTFYSLAEGNYTVIPYSDIFTFEPESQSLNPALGGSADFTAQPHAVHSISGRVTRSDGSGFSASILLYSNQLLEFIETDSNGYYSFDKVPAGGDYELDFGSGGLRIEPAKYNSHDLQSDQTGRDFKILPATISGRVTNPADGAGIAGVTLTLTGEAAFTPRTVTTAGNGAYSFTDVPTPDNYKIKPTLANYVFRPGQLVLYNVEADQPEQNFAAKPKTFGIIGVVRLGAARLPGVTVRLISPGQPSFAPLTLTTNSSGAYVFNTLPPGRRYTVTPLPGDYQFMPTSKSLAPLNANQQRVDFSVKAYSITGRITRSGTTTGIGAMTVTLTSSTPAGFAARAVQTNSTGFYTFTALPAGRDYTFKPVKSGFTFTPATRSITNLSSNIGAGASTNFTGTGP